MIILNNNDMTNSIYEIPTVLCKGNIMKDFDECNIRDTLLKETSIGIKDAEKIALEVKREIVFSGIKLITAPLLRELTNSVIIKLSANLKGIKKEEYERARLEDTRIGIPRYDLEQLIKKYPIQVYNNITGHYGKNSKLMDIIFKLVIEEYYAVIDLIKQKSDKINGNR